MFRKSKKLQNKKKANMGINTIFYIMMSIFLIWIIIFGYQKIKLSQDLITNQERLEIVSNLEQALEYCSDPLNKGSNKLIKINHPNFNSVCVLDDDSMDITDYIDNSILSMAQEEFTTIKNTGHNVILLKTTTIDEKINKYQIMDSFEILPFKKTQCFIDKENTGKLDLVFTCN